MKKYETTFIIDSLIKNEEIEGIITKVEKFISNNGGLINAVERWGKKRLAYEIKKRQYGYYVHIVFDAHNKLNRLLDREYQLDENILRYLSLLVDPRSQKVPEVKIDAADYDKKSEKNNLVESGSDIVVGEEPAESEVETEAEVEDTEDTTEETKESLPDSAS